MFLISKSALFMAAVLLLPLASATLSASDRGKKKDKEKAKPAAEETKDEGPKVLTQSLEELGLMNINIARKDIIKYHNYASENVTKNFPSPTLGFVTPWNNYGYDFAKEFAVKFDLISPVWLQIRGSFKDQACFFTGTHDVDKGWMAELKKRNPNLKIVPRIIFEAWTKANFEQLFGEEAFMHNCIRSIKTVCQEYGFDGVVMEMWLQAGLEFKKDMIHFLADLKIVMTEEKKLSIFVLPPAMRELSMSSIIVSRQDFAAIAPHIDYATLMTYDYFHPGAKPSATAPLPWVRANIEVLVADGDPLRAKILAGLNFYGYEFVQGSHPKPVLGRDVISKIRKYKPRINWETFGHENYLEYEDSADEEMHTVFYPTLRSISEKIDVAKQMGTGLMIWELGQGFRIFAELL